MALDSMNQARMTTWTARQDRDLKIVSEAVPCVDVMSAVTYFKPPTRIFKDQSDALMRDYQVLIVHTHFTASPRLAVVEAVFRGSVPKQLNQKTTREQRRTVGVPEPLPARCTSKIHIVFLDRDILEDEDGYVRYFCTNRSPVAELNPLDEGGQVRLQVSSKCIKARQQGFTMEPR